MQPAFETEETDDLHLTEAELAELHSLSERCKAHPEELSTWVEVNREMKEEIQAVINRPIALTCACIFNPIAYLCG